MKQEHKITRTSMFSGKEHTLTLVFDIEDYNDWQNGKLIQNAMPYLTADEREFLMTGVTSEEWKQTFGTEENPK